MWNARLAGSILYLAPSALLSPLHKIGPKLVHLCVLSLRFYLNPLEDKFKGKLLRVVKSLEEIFMMLAMHIICQDFFGYS